MTEPRYVVKVAKDTPWKAPWEEPLGYLIMSNAKRGFRTSTDRDQALRCSKAMATAIVKQLDASGYIGRIEPEVL